MTPEEVHALEVLAVLLDEAAAALTELRPGSRWVHAQAVALVRSMGDTIGPSDVVAIVPELRRDLQTGGESRRQG